VTSNANGEGDIRKRLHEAIAHFHHILPGQPPLKDFVHHNTLHAYQHYRFPRALMAAQQLTGKHGYYPQAQYLRLYKQGRVTSKDLIEVLNADPELDANRRIFPPEIHSVVKRDIYLCGLLHAFKPVTGCQLNWHIEELSALERFQSEVPEKCRHKIIDSSSLSSEAEIVADLWSACLQSLGFEYYIFHPEELTDLSPDQAETIVSAFADSADIEDKQQFRVRRQMRLEAEVLLSGMLKRVGKEYTLGDVLQALTGEDVLDSIRPLFVRQLGNHLDEGVAAWHDGDREQGFYASWRSHAARDLAWIFDDFPEWRHLLTSLPENALEAIISELRQFGLSEEHWIGYLERLALRLPGWSGMFLWRHAHPGYQALSARIEFLDYLAVFLILERLFARRLCRQIWNIAPDLDLLRWYFRTNKDEFLVRYALYNLRLPEYAVNRAHRLTAMSGERVPKPQEWRYVAHMIWTWRHSPAADRPKGHSVYRSGWRLFLLAQHLGLHGGVIRASSLEQVETMLDCLDRLTPEKAGYLWLQAFENHYRDRLFDAVLHNHDRGRWKTREQRPQSQVVFCMDDREEGIRRHLEERNPAIETLGAAGFFGVAINWKALDAETPTVLCPVGVHPAHEIREVVRAEDAAIKANHDKRRAMRLALNDFLLNDTRHGLFSSAIGIALAAPAALLSLIAKVVAPRKAENTTHRLYAAIDKRVPTLLALTAEDDGSEATAEQNRLGFTDMEQAERVQHFLRTIGLSHGFAPLVIIMGHGSTSENNPHEAAHDCGACSGHHGGPNARVFAAMANRPEVRGLLRRRGIDIPDDTWFVGAMHNTCDESFHWYDPTRVPSNFEHALGKLRTDLEIAARHSAHERCRKFDITAQDLSLERAYDHIQTRSYDISQVRPEFGHATNAAAFIGRRALSQGVFFDRRVFLISYDPSEDPEGSVLETILLNVGPVGAGINLEYYFSTVNNDQYGCSSKITHNVTGFFGVMDGTESDLRTGLPKQMIEIHEAMRLQVLVEAKTEIITAIYQRQPPLRELIGNGWILLSAKDPDRAHIQLFKPRQGWIPWRWEKSPIETVDCSRDWYRGHRRHLPPALIKQPERVNRA
jgi:uncharacterized protein